MSAFVFSPAVVTTTSAPVISTNRLHLLSSSAPATPPLVLDREDDGRWFAVMRSLPGVIAYGRTQEEARARAKALAIQVVAELLEHGEPVPAEAWSLVLAY